MTNRPMPLRSVDMTADVSPDMDVSFDQLNNSNSSNRNNVSFQIKSDKKAIINKSENKLKIINKDETAKVKTFFTTDKELLNQYYELRHQSYRDENGWKDFNGYENDFDRQGKIVVAVNSKGKVVGGMRLMFSDECKYLSNEIPGTEFTYQKVIGKYDKREGLVFGEISGIVISKDYRDRSVTAKSFASLIEESLEHGCQYVCGVGVAVVCRDYRMVFKSIGHYLEIVINLPWKQKQMYNFINMFPMYVKIS